MAGLDRLVQSDLDKGNKLLATVSIAQHEHGAMGPSGYHSGLPDQNAVISLVNRGFLK